MMTQIRSRRSHSFRTGFGLLALLSLIGVEGCSSDATTNRIYAADPNDPTNVDIPKSGPLSIDEAKISATVLDGKMIVQIPATCSGGNVKGTLNLSLLLVDGSKSLGTVEVPVSLVDGASTVLEAELSLPSDVKDQWDLVKYKIRLDQQNNDGIRINTSLLRVVLPYEVRLEGPASVTVDKKANWRVRVQNALSRQPLSGMTVKLAVKQQGQSDQEFSATTEDSGDAVFDMQLASEGSATVGASLASQGTQAKVEGNVVISAVGPKVLLTTDKPIYQPGQLIHIRTLSLDRANGTPLAGQVATFEVSDGKGNKIFKKTGTTDSYGIASTQAQLGPILNQGTFKISTTVGSIKTDKTVEVSNYTLPKFKTALTTDKTWYLAGQVVQGQLKSDYFFGKPVATGDVKIEASTLDIGQTVFKTIQGKTSASGEFSFQLALPKSLVGLPLERGNALINLSISVWDTAGQLVKKNSMLVVSQDGLDAALVPEATNIVPQMDNSIDLFVTDPQGAPYAATHAKLSTPNGKSIEVDTDEFGFANLVWNPEASCLTSCTLTAELTPKGLPSITKSFTFGSQTGSEHVVVRTDKSVYAEGESVDVKVHSTTDSGNVYVDWLNAGQVVDMRTLKAASGEASFSTALDTSRLGANRIEAYVVDKDGNIVRTGRTIFVRKSGALVVKLSTDKPQYKPGEKAKLSFSVTDEKGQASVAALGVQIVDEAVFGLIDAQPGLLRTFFELEDQFSKPSYEIHGPSGDMNSTFTGASDSDPKQAAAEQKKAGAMMAALGDKSPVGLTLGSWNFVVSNASTAMQPYYDKFRADQLSVLKTVFASAAQELQLQGCTSSTYFCTSTQKPYADSLLDVVIKNYKVSDFWGNSYKISGQAWNGISLQGMGPDEILGTGDDKTITYQLYELGAEYAYPSANDNGNGAAGAGGGAVGTAGSGGSGGSSSNPSADSPRVRSYFPETLYVNPALITDPNGTATVDLDMADSITSWRVSSLANSPAGKLGGGLDNVTVFQDFFADIDFPASLTLGDKIEFPITVYNYLNTAQTVTLELQSGDWYTPLGSTSKSVNLAPGQVLGVRFPVRVEKVGLYTLTVKALGSQLSDAVARVVRVEPGGKPVPTSLSGAVSGEVSHSVSFPANSIPGSSRLYLNIFPAFLSQAVSGMDSLLQTPNGCFEQTTSTTWPNVLVMDYMSKTGQITPAIQMKAESLITAGYQRLLTFEHPGGGFSWFGTQDPKPFLSVTAFGVMEFADMAKVHTVDEAMLARTINWLAAQQKADGSWDGDQSEFFSFQTSTLRNSAFVLWALAVADYKGTAIGKGVDYVTTNTKLDSADPYTLGILANALLLTAPNNAVTTAVFDKIIATQKTDDKKFYWPAGDTQTNMYGSGSDADVTTTALIAQALIRVGGYGDSVRGALEYLVSKKDSLGNFGSTQATIWTLRALLLSATSGTDSAVGTLDVSLDGKPFSKVNLTVDQSDVMTTVDLGSSLASGGHQVKLSFVGTGKASYHLVSNYNLAWVDVPVEPKGPVSITIAYDKTELALNEMATATVDVTNNTDKTQNMVMVTVGVPPGFQVVGEDFDTYLKSGVLSRWESTGKQLMLYISTLKASSTQKLTYRLQATMPVTASDGGGEAHLYYQPDKQTTVASTTFTVHN